jgi:hypothetical protein
MDAFAHRLQWLNEQRRCWVDLMYLAFATQSGCAYVAVHEIGVFEDLIAEAEMDYARRDSWRVDDVPGYE